MITSTKVGLMCLAQGNNAVTPVKLEPAALRSRAKHSTPESHFPPILVVLIIVMIRVLFCCVEVLLNVHEGE